MREIVVTVDVFGNTPAVVLDQYLTPFQVTYAKSGSGTVQVSLTDPYPVQNGSFVTANFVWETAPDLPPNATGFLGQPFRAIRLTGASQGETLTVIQSGVK
jgi:hypothetical protein